MLSVTSVVNSFPNAYSINVLGKQMKIVVSADEYCPVIDTLLEELERRGHETIYFGPKKGEESLDWTTVTLDAVQLIRSEKADEGIVCCWTGTGATLIANKMKGIRAALCGDGETAAGARKWNHANTLGLSLRLLTPELLREILDAWFHTPFTDDPWNLEQIDRIHKVEQSLPI